MRSKSQRSTRSTELLRATRSDTASRRIIRLGPKLRHIPFARKNMRATLDDERWMLKHKSVSTKVRDGR